MKKYIFLFIIIAMLAFSVTALDTGITTIGKSSVDMNPASGEVKFSDADNMIAVTTTTFIDDRAFVPLYEAKSGDKVIWGTDEKYLFIFPDPVTKFEYSYSDRRIKETITLKEDKKLSFGVKLEEGTKIIPWDNGQWKIVSTTSAETMNGIIAEKPFGIDAAGRYVEMNYTYDKETSSLILNYDRIISVYNDKLTQEQKPDEKTGLKTPIFDQYPITYPLVIDPTWTQVGDYWITAYDTYNVVKFNATGTTNWTVPAGITSIDVVVIGGGGGGGGGGTSNYGGGGGAGLFANQTGRSVTAGTNISLTIGAGGAMKNNGGCTTFANITAFGGGSGGWDIDSMGRSGGSGGGNGGYDGENGGTRWGGLPQTNSGGGSTAYGNKGGNATFDHTSGSMGAGGGGAGGIGYNGTSSGYEGYGGPGIQSNITGELTWYAAGGGGNFNTLYGRGGSNFTGGNGSTSSVQPRPGKLDTGSGGGGGWTGSTQGVGASGVVIIRYLNVSTPTAAFTMSNTSGSSPLKVNFTDTSSGAPTSWNWTFGAANFSNAQNPNYLFVGAGNYSVILNVSNDYGYNISPTQYINVSILPVANFTANITTLYFPNTTVQFYDNSTNSPTNWSWIFGDETYTQSYTIQNASSGWIWRNNAPLTTLHNGSIIIAGGEGPFNDTWISIDKGVTWTLQNASSGWEARSGNQLVTLSDNSLLLMGGSTGGAGGFKNDVWRSTDEGKTWVQQNASAGWTGRSQFGAVVLQDGSVVIAGGDSITYGLYNDTWRSTDKGVTWTRQNASSGWQPRSLMGFFVLSDDTIISAWGYGNTNVANDTWISNDKGVTWLSQGKFTDYGYYYPFAILPDDSIISIRTVGHSYRSNNKGITWDAIPIGVGSYQDTGATTLPDGSVILYVGNQTIRVLYYNTFTQNPIHTYNSSGIYNVSLRSTGLDWWNTSVKVGYITILNLPPTAAFLMSNVSGPTPLKVNFTDRSTGNGTKSYNWTFGAANFSNAQNPNYIFDGIGNYSITLNISNDGGFSVLTKYVNVFPPLPVANFSANITVGNISLPVLFTDSSTNSPTNWSWTFGDETYTNGWVRQNNSVWGSLQRFGGVALTLQNGSIIFIAGFDTGPRNETRMSPNKGLNWYNITGSPIWTGRYYLTGGVFSDNTIIIAGGNADSIGRNDTWTSTDNGTTWTLMNVSSGWVGRYGLTSVILPDDSIVVMGGYNGSAALTFNDTWRSTDKGATWVRQNASSGWNVRYYASSVVMDDGSIVIMGGQSATPVYRNDTWRSTDKGLTWTNITGSPGWTGRSYPYVVKMPDNSIVLMGGQDSASPPWKNDTWRSTDSGTTWNLTNITAGWLGRTAGSSVVLPDGSVIIIGGRTSTSAGSGTSDAWRLSPQGSNDQNPVHIYTETGIFNVSLTAYNQYGWNTTRKIAYINATAPTSTASDFTANNTICTMYPCVVQYNDTTLYTPTTWNWSFGDGRWFNTTTASLKNATYTYAVAGKYTVNLTTNNTIGNNTISKTQFINLTSDDDANVSTWLHMNNSFNGEKGTAWTVSGSAQISNSIFKYGGGSGYFPTAGKPYIYTPSSSAFNFSTGDFTIEMWVNSTNPKAGDQIIHKGNNAQTTGWGLDNNNGSQNGWDFYMGNDTTGQTDFFTILNNNWTHVVVERQSTIIYVYINGNLTTTKTGMGGNYDTTDRLEVGFLGPSSYYEGYVDELRISKGLARWNANFTPPYNEYKGVLETQYPDINPNSTMRYKTNPGGNASISNTTPRNRTIQIENVYNTSYVIGTATFDPLYFTCKAVRLNESYFPTGMVLVSSNINNVLGEVSFNVSRAAGFNAGTNRASIIDYELVYYNYSQPGTYAEFFGSGYLLNGSTFKLYPIHNFISTNVSLLEWTITTNFTANNLTTPVNLNVNFTDDSWRYGSYPNQWNWSFGDGTWNNGTNQSITHPYTSGGLKTVSLTAGLWQNNSIYTTLTKTDYINVLEYPVASFTSNATSGTGATPILFNDTTPNFTSAWEWSFRNVTGNDTEIWFSTIQNTTWIFNTGNYSIRLNASNAVGYNITPGLYFINITPLPLPIVDFSANNTLGIQGLPVLFTDLSTSNILSWNWSFGGSNFSTTQNPVYVFNDVGTYTITLNVTNTSGYNASTKIDYITINPRVYPFADFTANITSGQQNLTVLFWNTSLTSCITAWNWSFGGSNFSTLPNPVYTFNEAGSYTISMNVTNSSGYNSSTKIDYIVVSTHPAPNASFTLSNTSSLGVPLVVRATDTTTGAPTAWNWTFGGANFSNAQNPLYTFIGVGHYAVTLNTSNYWGYCVSTQYVDINPIVLPIPWFSANRTVPMTGTPVLFTDASTTTIIAWNWSFGDGSYSNVQNPVYSYVTIGRFDVTLTVQNASGVNATTRLQYINTTSAPFLIANFVGNPTTTGYTYTPIVFTDTSTGNDIDAWSWDFGDGHTSTAQNPPAHTYPATGLYTVRLTASSSVTGLTDYEQKNQYIVISNGSVPVIVPNPPIGGIDLPNESNYGWLYYMTVSNRTGPWEFPIISFVGSLTFPFTNAFETTMGPGMGNVVFLILWGIFILMVWRNSGHITIPALIGAITAGAWALLMPESAQPWCLLLLSGAIASLILDFFTNKD
jgi:PKD repeat protein